MEEFVKGYEESILGCPDLRREYDQLLRGAAAST